MSKESAYFQISHITGNHDTKELKQELDTIPGVLSVSVNVERNTLGVDYDNAGVTCDQLEKRLVKSGYQVKSCKTENHIM